MNREIKFRIWDSKNKMWMTQQIDIESGCPEWINNKVVGDSIFPVSLDWILTHPKFWITQQFTGLKDKNGKDIYDGDILKIKGYLNYFEVGFNFSCFCVLINKVFYSWMGQFNSQNLEVSGNIFENPELLK